MDNSRPTFSKGIGLLLIFLSVANCSNNLELPADQRGIGRSLADVMVAFEEECVGQKHADWVTRTISKKIEICGGSATDCAARLDREISWPAGPAKDGIRITYNWYADQTLTPHSRPIACSLFLSNDRAAELLNGPSEFTIGNAQYSGPVEVDPRGDHTHAFLWISSNSVAPRLELSRWMSPTEYRDALAKQNDGNLNVARNSAIGVVESFHEKYESAPWELREINGLNSIGR